MKKRSSRARELVKSHARDRGLPLLNFFAGSVGHDCNRYRCHRDMAPLTGSQSAAWLSAIRLVSDTYHYTAMVMHGRFVLCLALPFAFRHVARPWSMKTCRAVRKEHIYTLACFSFPSSPACRCSHPRRRGAHASQIDMDSGRSPPRTATRGGQHTFENGDKKSR